MNIKLSTIRLIIVYSFMLLPLSGIAMDIVTLKDGKVLKGDIYQKDSDGSVFINLTDGTKRYIMPDEILTTSQDNVPFEICYEENSHNGTSIPLDINVYAGYEQLMPTKFHSKIGKADILKSSPGAVVGVSVGIPIFKDLFILPGFEIAYGRSNYNDPFKYNGKTFFAYGKPTDWLFVRIPVQVGYKFSFSDKCKLLIHTGPVVEAYIGYNESGWEWDDAVISASTNPSEYFGYEDDFEAYSHWNFNRFNVDWRFGLRFDISKISVGIAYSIGMTNRINKVFYTHEINQDNNWGYYNVPIINPSLKKNNLQISVGFNL